MKDIPQNPVRAVLMQLDAPTAYNLAKAANVSPQGVTYALNGYTSNPQGIAISLHAAGLIHDPKAFLGDYQEWREWKHSIKYGFFLDVELFRVGVSPEEFKSFTHWGDGGPKGWVPAEEAFKVLTLKQLQQIELNRLNWKEVYGHNIQEAEEKLVISQSSQESGVA